MLHFIDNLALDNIISFLNIIDSIHLKRTNIYFYHYITTNMIIKRLIITFNSNDFDYPFSYHDELLEIIHLDQFPITLDLINDHLDKDIMSIINQPNKKLTNNILIVSYFIV